MSQCYTGSPYLGDFEVGRSFREPQITRAPDHERAELGLRMIRQTAMNAPSIFSTGEPSYLVVASTTRYSTTSAGWARGATS